MKKHLPLLGVGPMIGLGQLLITIIIILICKMLNTDFAEIQVLKTPFRILGVLLILTGLYFNYSAKRKSKLFENIKKNRLVTDGIYRYVTIFLIHTEEKWLRNLYGQEYEEYCKRVNRCIPWFQHNHRCGSVVYSSRQDEK